MQRADPGSSIATATAPSPYAGSASFGETTMEKPGTRYIGKWNWGAAFLFPYWLMTHRRVPLGIMLFVAQIIRS